MTLRTEALEALLRSAAGAVLQAYAPYSGFRVGAALLLDNGATVSGCNVENASYGLTLCAERAALVRAVSEHGPAIRVAAIAVANGSGAASAPCGACRQVLAEFVTPDAWIVFPGDAGRTHGPVPFTGLLPFRFSLEKV